MARLTIVGLQHALEAANGMNKAIAQKVDGLTDELAQAARLHIKAINERDEARKQIGHLKQERLALETETARLNGYLDRVREDDLARDPPLQVAEHTTAEFQPRRAPRRHRVDAALGRSLSQMLGEDEVHRTHWTDFGR